MAKAVIRGINLNYEIKGDRGRSVILLHGWGQNMAMMDYIATFLSRHFVVYNMDLPGFGESGEPDRAWSVDDYVEFLHDFVNHFNIESPILIGHSFGCRIALYYAYKYDVFKMCLTGAAGVKPKRGIRYYVSVYSYKLGKIILKPFKGLSEKLRKNAGSSDYQNSSDIMKGTLIQAVNFDITPYLKDIKPETLLVFGDKDDSTPLYMGKIMEEKMPDAALVVFECDDHFAYFHQGDRFNLVLEAFLKKYYA